MVLPMVFPRAPAMRAPVNVRSPVLTKYPTTRYKICDEGKLTIPFAIMRIKIAKYEPDEMREWRSIGTVYTDKRQETTDSGWARVRVMAQSSRAPHFTATLYT